MFVSIYHAKFTLSKTKCTKIIELKTKFKNLKLKCLYWIFSKQNDQQKVYMKNILVFKEQTKNIQYSIPQKKTKYFTRWNVIIILSIKLDKNLWISFIISSNNKII